MKIFRRFKSMFSAKFSFNRQINPIKQQRICINSADFFQNIC